MHMFVLDKNEQTKKKEPNNKREASIALLKELP